MKQWTHALAVSRGLYRRKELVESLVRAYVMNYLILGRIISIVIIGVLHGIM